MHQDYISGSEVVNIIELLQDKISHTHPLFEADLRSFLKEQQIQNQEEIHLNCVHTIHDFIYQVITNITQAKNPDFVSNLQQYNQQQLKTNLVHILRIEPASYKEEKSTPDVMLKFKIFEMGAYKVKLHMIGAGSLQSIYIGVLSDSCQCLDSEDYWTAFKQFIINLNSLKKVTINRLCFCVVFVTKQQYGKNGEYGTGSQLRLSKTPCSAIHDTPFMRLFNDTFLGKEQSFLVEQIVTADQYIAQVKQIILWGTNHLKPYYILRANHTQKLQVKFLVYRFYFAQQVIEYLIRQCRFDSTVAQNLLIYYRMIARLTLISLLESNLYNQEKIDKVTERIYNINNLLGNQQYDINLYKQAAITFIRSQPSSLIKFRMLCLINSDALLYNKCLQTFQLYSQATLFKLGVTPTQIELVLLNPKYQPLIADMIKQQSDRINSN